MGHSLQKKVLKPHYRERIAGTTDSERHFLALLSNKWPTLNAIKRILQTEKKRYDYLDKYAEK